MKKIFALLLAAVTSAAMFASCTSTETAAETVSLGDVLTPGADGILTVAEGAMKWQVVKVYTMPDGQKGVKIMRIA